MVGSWLGKPPLGFGRIVPKSANIVIGKPELRPRGDASSTYYSVRVLAFMAVNLSLAARRHG
jgi:hypothetical protein